jgi:hypothetical protein
VLYISVSKKKMYTLPGKLKQDTHDEEWEDSINRTLISGHPSQHSQNPGQPPLEISP